MKRYVPRKLADYAGVINASLCLLHCLGGPLLLTWLGYRLRLSIFWEAGFLLVSAGAVLLASRKATTRLRVLLWTSLIVFIVAGRLHAWWAGWELVQHVAAAGLIVAHVLNIYVSHRMACAGSTDNCVAA